MLHGTITDYLSKNNVIYPNCLNLKEAVKDNIIISAIQVFVYILEIGSFFKARNSNLIIVLSLHIEGAI